MLLSSNSPRQYHILHHNRHPSRMNRAQIRILHQAHQKGLKRMLQCFQSRTPVSYILLVALGYILHDPLERQLPDKQVGRLLVLSDLSESDCTWPVSVGLLDASGRCEIVEGGLSCG